MTNYQILYWHDIPVQVRAGGRRDRSSVQLPERFQEAVDAAAMAAGLTGSDAYLEGFVWGESQTREGLPNEVSENVAAELDKANPTIDWRATVKRLKAG